jgi:prepilin-type N-terminal cleavage/methylation domain-containing protein
MIKIKNRPLITYYLQPSKGFTLTNKIGQGFTLIEILVSTGILVILGMGLLGLQYVISKNQVTAWTSFSSIESANNSVTQISKELRNATESDNGAYPLDTLLDSEIIFYSDVDYDNVVERVRYTLSGNNFIRGITDPSGDPTNYDTATEKTTTISDIVRNGSDPVFYYFNGDYPTDTVNNPLTQGSRIAETRYVKIYLRTNTKTGAPDEDYILEGEIKIRMLEGVN